MIMKEKAVLENIEGSAIKFISFFTILSLLCWSVFNDHKHSNLNSDFYRHQAINPSMGRCRGSKIEVLDHFLFKITRHICKCQIKI